VRQAWNRLPLKWQILVASVSLSLLGIAIVSVAAYRSLYATIEQSVQADLQHSLREVEEVLQARTSDLVADVGILAASSLVLTAVQDSAEQLPYLDDLFANLLRGKPFAVGVSLHDYRGRPISTSGREPTEARLPFARRVIEEGVAGLAELPGDRQSVGVAAPVRLPTAGTHEGALVVVVDVARFLEEVLPPLLPGVVVTFQDGTGQSLYQSAEPLVTTLRQSRAIQLRLGGTRNEAGAAVRAAGADVAMLRAEVSLPQEVVDEPTLRLALSAIVAALLAILSSTAVAFWLAARLSRPLESIAERLDLIAARPQDAPPLPSISYGSAETNRLVGSFGRMVDSVDDYRTKLEQLLLERTDALAEAESRLAGIVRALDDAVYSYFVDTGEVVYVSPSTERIYGIDLNALGTRVEEARKLCLDEDRHILMAKDEHLRNSRQPIQVRYRIRRRDGTIRWVRDTARSMLVTVDGITRLRAHGTISDLTSLVETELARDAALEQLRVLQRGLVSARNGILISDATAPGRPLIFVNPAFERITGYRADEALGQDCKFLQGELVDQPAIGVLRQALRDGRNCRVVLRNFRKDGTLFWNELSVSPVLDEAGRLTHFVGVIEDITATVEREAKLRETTERLDTVFALSPDAVVCFDAAGRIAAHNPALARMLCVTEEALADLSLVGFEQLVRAQLDPASPAAPGQSLFDGAVRFELLLQKPTRYLRVGIERTPEAGQLRTILYMRDVTHEVEVDRMKSEFLSVAAHELRTPLASVRGYAELLLHRKFPEPVREEMLGTIARQAVRLSDLVNELLDLARIEARAGKDFRFECCALQDIVEAVVDELPIAAAARVRIEADAELPAVMADTRKMHQAIANLVNNAIKYSAADSGVVVRIAQRPHPVLGDVPSVTVLDRGIGMKPEHLARAFERFFRADPSGATPGTGLGLPLVHEIVEIHGGRIELRSEYGAGTEAVVWLPIAPDMHADALDGAGHGQPVPSVAAGGRP
jgi:PAS domain S-box-containing protein